MEVLHQGPKGWFTTGTAGAPHAQHTCKENTQLIMIVYKSTYKISKTVAWNESGGGPNKLAARCPACNDIVNRVSVPRTIFKPGNGQHLVICGATVRW